MAVYKPTMSYRVIYIFTIHDAQHKGCWKIGETNFDGVNSYKQLTPNCEELNRAAHDRIDQYTKTAMVKYDLQYTELARRTVTFADGTTDTELFHDDDVHDVLYNSGFTARKFTSKQDSEWFEVSLPIAIRAIQAVKEGRAALTAAEKSEGQTGFLPLAVPVAPKKKAITLRDEQVDCVNRTLTIFRKQNSMLWNCKMRFGKTVTAYALIKKAGYQKVIVVTHRPVVEDGWRNDFDLIFGEGDDRTFLKKDRFDTDSSVYDAAMDARNDASLMTYKNSDKAFVYFASMQDLRGSKRADGKFDKNNAVFDMDWDLVIYDEAHEGTQTERGQKVQTLLEAEKNGKTPKVLQLSGTPYNLMQKYQDNVYTWDYVMEQKRKREWDTLHPGDHNPYADLPELRILTFDLGKSLPTSYRYATTEMAFNFTEFFRVWTGDPARDFRPLPSGAQVGDFVHEADVRSFLRLISSEDSESNYPFSTPEYREMFRHTLWMVPGVKEAAALSRLLKEEGSGFEAYKIANVAGDGDVEMPYDNALQLVRKVIHENRYTITISCGKLTTGVTVPEWTAVMMLTGSASTAASGYMQTIFRVQSAGVLDGKQKERCYVFDFAPDRALNILSEVNRVTRHGKINEEENRKALGEFLNFCPVIAVDGTQMTEYSVPKMMRQIKRLTVDKAIKSGFDDESVYKQDTGIVMDEDDVELFHTLSDKLSEQKAAKKETKVHINNQGLTNEEYEEASKLSNKPKRERSKEEEELLKKLQDQRKERDKVIRLLRNVSIRLPLLIYGAKVDLTEEIHMVDFIGLVDDESWQEFMPKGVSKPLFRKLLKYYDEDVVSGAGLRIRRMARAADDLPPTKRVQRIAEIFSYFRNPDKETVLTPWRVVNLHLSNMIGGYCFLNEQFDAQDVLDEPRLVDQGDVTEDIFLDPNARILEMNSKSGLYPLYMAYSLYAMKLPGAEDKLSLEQTQALWQETVEQQIFVLCKTKMAQSITRRTLAGYQDWTVNTTYIPHLLERMEKDPERLAKKLQRTDTWRKEGEPMKFDAIVGNPPYQIADGGNNASAMPIYQKFVELATAVEPHYISMIMPSRWYSGGRGLDDFRTTIMNDIRMRVLYDYASSDYCFPGVDISGGICYFLWDKDYNGPCTVTNAESQVARSVKRYLNEFPILVRSNAAISIIDKVADKKEKTLDTFVSSQRPFGLRTFARPDKSGELTLRWNGGKGPISSDKVTGGTEFIDKWKVIVSRVLYEHGGKADKNGQSRILSILEVLGPKEVCSETYIVVNSYETEAEAIGLYSYLKTKFARFLIMQATSSIMITRGCFMFVPIQDFSKPWTDQELYKKYGLTEDEITFIESTIRVIE